MPKRFLVLSLLFALVAVPAALTAAASASTQVSAQAKSSQRAHRQDRVRPAVKIKRAAGQSKRTSRLPVRFTISFSEPVTGFTAKDVRLSGTATASKVTILSRSGRKTFKVSVTKAKRAGTIVATVPARAAKDAAGNRNTAGNRVTVSTSSIKVSPKKRPTSPRPVQSPPVSSPPVSSPPVSSPPATSLIVGSVIDAAGNGPNALDTSTSVGVRWAREEISWSAVERTQGTLDWSRYDTLFSNAAQKGVHVLPLVDGIPSWAGASDASMPSDPSRFAAFVAKVAARYGPGGTFWQSQSSLAQFAPTQFEIWNEPWLPYFSNPVDPARYARLFKASASAGRAANSQARFIVAAEWQYQAADGSWRKWVDDMYTAVPDLNSYADAYSTHPYGNGSVDNWTPGNGDAFETRRLEIVHNNFVSHGAGDKKMWVTEIGWSTCSSGDNCYSETEQRQNLTRFDQLARTSWSSFIAATFYYRLVDLNGSDRTNKELWFGVIRADGSFKPAYDVLRTIAAAA